MIEQIDKGELFKRNPITFVTTKLTQENYGGLFGRSATMLNAKIFYENQRKGISATLRGFYRGRYGLGDMNGNLVLDEDNEYVAGYFTCNFSVSKELFKQKVRIQTGIDNVFNQQDTQNIPTLAGRLLWAGAMIKIF